MNPLHTLASLLFASALSLTFSPQTRAASSFIIEAEDFNHGSGQHLPLASTMPYYGGAYNNLSATPDVDYHQVDNDGDSDLYRIGEFPNVPMVDNLALDSSRSGWTVTTSYRIGWTSEGDWYNYTRTFPDGNYYVYAALSYEGSDPGQLRGSLHRVTSGATSSSQTLSLLGTFDSPGSGGWGVNLRVPLNDSGGTPILLPLSGLTTLRYTAGSGDIDYFVFEPGIAGELPGVLREVWNGIPGVNVGDLTNHTRFPGQPDTENILSQFEAPIDVAEDYGQRLQAYLWPPTSGNYTFWIASDDNSALFLSTNDSPANKRLIASVPEWTPSRDWSRYAQQQSAPIPLVAGQKYYVEALMKEGNGGDNLAVRWRLPSGIIEEPIPASRLTVYGLGPPEITQQPANSTVIEGGSATFTVTLARSLGSNYQWQRGTTDLPGATTSVYTIPVVTIADHGATFRCVVSNSFGIVTSNPATLSVTADTIPPTIVSVVNLGDNTRVTVLFSEPVETLTATNPAYYTLNNGANVFSATFAGDTRTIVLGTSTLSAGTTYTLTVNNVRDRATSPNTIQPNSQRSFTLDYTPLSANSLKGTSEPPGPSSRTTGLAISEIMYHPAPRTDGRNIEFIELFNSEAEAHNVSGYRISGSVDYTFPQGTVIPARAYRVVAAVPADVQSVYSIANVLGPFTGNLPNSSGLVRLRNNLDAVLLEIEYADSPPWPLAADGAGHSLVLARPSYGESDVRAWAQSDILGGTPGSAETPGADPFRSIIINEFLAHTDLPQLDFIELHNYGSQPVNVSGCTISDRSDVDKFVIPTGTSIPAKGFLSFTETQLGFALSTLGEDIYLKNPSRNRVIDSIRFEAQANGVATGRYPDGAPNFHELVTPTPGLPNANLLLPNVVINEIMFNPMSGDDLDEFVELHNRSAAPINLGGWRFTDGINFTFPNNTIIPANAYLVVANNLSRLLANYPSLSSANTVGNYSGSLANSGERLTLARFETTVTTNNNVAVTNTIHVVVDQVSYNDGGRWARWANRGGSSLELIDPRSDNRLGANWADSDETAKSSWVTVQHTGIIDLGNGASDELHIMLLGAGECLLDNIEVFASGGPNRVPNGTFESGLNDWILQGNHVQSQLHTSQGFNSSRSLLLRASAGGDNGANRAKIKLSSGFANGETVTIRAQTRWLSGHTNLLLRLRGNYLEAVGSLTPPLNLGTPGTVNSRRLVNAGPAIHGVTHNPILPAAGQTVQIVAQVHDPDGLAALHLVYRIDPSTNLITVSMVANGAGFYSANIPGQSSGTTVAFHLRATDAHPSAPATTRFPDDAPARECLVRFGEATPSGTFGVYRLWMTQANVSTWASRERLSNEALDGTFIYGNSRVVYNAGARYRGSPFIRPGYNSPIGNLCAYVWTMPKDEPVLGSDEFNLDTLEPGRDQTRQREKTSFWIAGQLGVPFSYQRYVHLYVNGNKRGDIYTDSQQPNSEYVRSWFPNDNDGEIFKIDDWFEFNDSVAMQFNIDATLQVFTTTGGAFKQARYRWNWEKKSNRGLDDDYSSLFALVNTLQTPGTHPYTDAVETVVDIEQWLRVFAARHIVADWDGYGYNRGKNQFAYKPQSDGWKMLLWDLDFSLGGGSDSPDTSLFAANDPTISRIYQHPPFRRAYFRALYDAAYGPLLSTVSGPAMDATYSALLANGISAESPATIKNWIAARRNYILQQLATVAANFEFTVNNGNNFSTAQNLVTLSGTAPVQIKTIRINGVAYPVRWSSVNNWSLQLPVGSGANILTLQAYDSYGNLLSGLSDTITVTYTGTPHLPQDYLVLNEIMFNPAGPNAEFVEIHNRSTTTAFDLSNYRLNGVDFNFPEGTVIPPNGYLLAVENFNAFLDTYGTGLPIAGAYSGKLDNGGETLKLIQRGATPELDLLIDEVTYDDDPPWPVDADGFGPSLQLIDPAQDNNRLANWIAVTGGGSQAGPLIGITDVWKYNQTGTDLGTSWRLPAFNDTAWPSGPALLYVESDPLPAPKNTSLSYTSPQQTTFYFRKSFNFSGNPATTALAAHLIVDDGAIVYLNGTEVLRLGLPTGPIAYSDFANRTVDNAIYEGPFTLPNSSLLQGANVIAVEVHQVNPTSSDIVFGLALDATSNAGEPFTPGAPNSSATTLPTLPSLWLNELQSDNASGIQDRFGEHDPWVELFNSGTNTLTLDGFYLSDSYTNLTRWAFPAGVSIAPDQFHLVWLDAQPAQTGAGELHASFRIPSLTGTVALVQVANNRTSILDYLNYHLLAADRSYGAYPDGTPAKRTRFYIPTPGASNTTGYPELPVVINEWMAGNSSTITDPSDGQYDDWFELHNAGPDPVDLSGFTLTDDLDDPSKWTVPDATIIHPGAFLLVWADGQPDQNAYSSDLHADFKLSLDGEAIGLFAPNGALIDSISFGPQTNDVSQGRWPDADANLYFMSQPTPRNPNIVTNPNNTPPTLATISNKSVNEQSLLSFTVTATDPDPNQTLTFSLDPGAPAGAAINPDSGLFTWTPVEAQGPGLHSVTIRVTDNGSPTLSHARTISITVNEVNRPPVLSPIGSKSANEMTLLSFTALASDPDLPANSLSFSLDEGAPAGASIQTGTGLFSWTPTESQGPGLYSVTIIVRDNGTPALNASETISVTVHEVNRAPVLNPIANQQVTLGNTLNFTATASDPDLPANALTFSLDSGAPSGATIHPSTGVFTWTPQASQAPSTNNVTARITDSGTPSLSATRTFQIIAFPAGTLQFTDITVSPSGIVSLTWNSEPATVYRLEYKDDLASTTWLVVGDYTATSSTTSANHSTSGSPHRYYKVSRNN
jgi:hypothetical protein